MDITSSNSGDIIQLGDGWGRGYPLGRARAVFKADGAETNDSYSVSEWWLDPGFAGFANHRHDANDDMFYVLAGEVTFVLDGQTNVAGAGSFLRVPPGVEHDYRNDGSAAARILNVFIPGGLRNRDAEDRRMVRGAVRELAPGTAKRHPRRERPQ